MQTCKIEEIEMKKKLLIACLVVFALAAVTITSVLADPPTRFDPKEMRLSGEVVEPHVQKFKMAH
jgi:hypothetical protein